MSKPTVDVSFTGESSLADPTAEPSPALWAHDNARRIAAAVLLAAFCIGIASTPIASGNFLPADNETVALNPILYQWGFGMKTIWSSPQNLPQVSPMAFTIMLVENQFFADHPAGYHLISLLLHIANTLLLLRLLNRLELPGAWLGAALFALHPLQIDTVCWISQQRYLICGVFFFSALLVYLRRVGLNPTPQPSAPGSEPLIRLSLPESPGWLYAISMILFTAALLSHLVAAAFPLVVLIMIWWERGTIRKTDWRPLIFPMVLSLLLVSFMARIAWHHSGQFWTNFAGWRWLIYVGHGVWSALLTIVLPISLSFAHARWDVPPPSPWQIILTLGFVFVLVAFWKLRVRWGRGPLAAALLFCVLLLPAAFGANDSGSLPGITLSEHQLYFAMAAVVVPVAALFMEWFVRSKLGLKMLALPGSVPVAAVAVGLIITLSSSVHSEAYASSINAWQQVLRGYGDSEVALNALGELEMRGHNLNKAEAYFRDALIADPTQISSLYHLADVASERHEYDRAIALYDQILNKHPDELSAQLQLADSYGAQGNSNDALAEYQRALKQHPLNATIYNQLGLIYDQRGESDLALKSYQKAIDIEPKEAIAYLNMANTYFQLGRYLDAKHALEAVIRMDPHNFIVWMNAGVMASSIGDLASGENYFHLAMYYNPKSADACIDLGKVLLRWGSVPGKKSRVDESIAYFKRALSLDPDNPDAKANLAEAERRRELDIAQGRR